MKEELTAMVRRFYRLVRRGVEAQRRDYQDYLQSEAYSREISLSDVLSDLRVSWRMNIKYFHRGLELFHDHLKELNEYIDADTKEYKKPVNLH